MRKRKQAIPLSLCPWASGSLSGLWLQSSVWTVMGMGSGWGVLGSGCNNEVAGRLQVREKQEEGSPWEEEASLILQCRISPPALPGPPQASGSLFSVQSLLTLLLWLCPALTPWGSTLCSNTALLHCPHPCLAKEPGSPRLCPFWRMN